MADPSQGRMDFILLTRDSESGGWYKNLKSLGALQISVLLAIREERVDEKHFVLFR